MNFIYGIFISLYTFTIIIASLFNSKARLWVKGRKGIFSEIEKVLKEKDPLCQKKHAWFHCASLGEFEQGRPVIEEYRKKYPHNLIVVTFFSPSGYEIRKNYSSADLVCYLPSDTRSNAKKFISLVKPEVAVFIKYEFWFNYLEQLRSQKIKIYFISLILRPSQHFFQWYGAWFKRQLQSVTWFFVQDTDSMKLLQRAGYENVSVSGDTRFDRVSAIGKNPKDIPHISDFCGRNHVLIAGSTWPQDEKLLLTVIRQAKMKVIIAPHEIGRDRIKALESAIGVKALKYSMINSENASSADVLIIDSIGLLSSLYRYSTVAFIGGGFGNGIHNILEAAAFGVPIIFGPNYLKFREAHDLIRLHGAYSIENEEQLVQILDNISKISLNGAINSKYVYDNQGATQQIMEYL